MSVANTIKKLGLEQAFDYLYKAPEHNMLKLMDWADKFVAGEFKPQRKAIREAMEHPEHPYHDYILHIVRDIDPKVTHYTYEISYNELARYIDQNEIL